MNFTGSSDNVYSRVFKVLRNVLALTLFLFIVNHTDISPMLVCSHFTWIKRCWIVYVKKKTWKDMQSVSVWVMLSSYPLVLLIRYTFDCSIKWDKRASILQAGAKIGQKPIVHIFCLFQGRCRALYDGIVKGIMSLPEFFHRKLSYSC